MERTRSRTRGGLGGGFVLFLMVPLLGCAATKPPAAHAKRETPKATNPQVLETYGKLPLAFEPNQGQTDSQVQFLSRGAGYTLFLTPTEAVLALREPQAQANTLLRMRLVGANPAPQVTGLGELPGKVNSFIGNDPTRWRTNVPTYSKVEYQQVYPGVNLVYYGNQRQLEYDFVVSPGADAGAITLAFEGMDGVAVDALGDLVLRADAGEVRLRKPVVYQDHDGQRTVIPTRYVIKGERQVAFEVAAYDGTQPLIIDPVLVYSTTLGGEQGDEANAIAVDGLGNAYIVGETNSANFRPVPDPNPIQVGGFANGGPDAFVSKLNPAGTALVYSTYLGGTSIDRGLGISVDSSGSAYVTGVTSSGDFPTTTTTGAFQPTHGGGTFDAFVTKLDAAGTALVYSTYLGGISHDEATGIAVDSAGNAYITGWTRGAFPTINPVQPNFGGAATDAFVAKLDADGAALAYSTYLGGSGDDSGHGIAVDAFGNAYVTGSTSSADFPTFPTLPTEVVPRPDFGGGAIDAFVAKLDAAGAALAYSTYLGGNRGDFGHAIAVDAGGNAYVTGVTSSTDFPTRPLNPIQSALAGASDAFVAKLDTLAASGPASLVYSTYLGGTNTPNSASESGLSIAVDAFGNAHVTGQTDSGDFPPATPLQGLNGFSDAFVAKLNATGTALVYSTFLGGSGGDGGRGIAVDAVGNAYVTGFTSPNPLNPDFPLDFPTVNPLPRGQYGPTSAFVAKLGPPPNTLAGQDVVVQPVDLVTGTSPVTLTFANVITSGNTTLTTSASPPPPAGFQLGTPPTYYELATTASFDGGVKVCINYSGVSFQNEADLKLFHFEDTNSDSLADTWKDRTASLDPIGKIICGSVTSLSPFAIFEPVTNATKPFAAFQARVEIEDDRHEREFEVKATFALDALSDGIDPLTEEVSFQVGSFSTTIPAGSFKEEKKGRFKRDRKERFKFEGVIAGVELEAVIRPLGGGRYEFKAEVEGVALTGTVSPVEVSLTIGDDGGNTVSVGAARHGRHFGARGHDREGHR